MRVPRQMPFGCRWGRVPPSIIHASKREWVESSDAETARRKHAPRRGFMQNASACASLDRICSIVHIRRKSLMASYRLRRLSIFKTRRYHFVLGGGRTKLLCCTTSLHTLATVFYYKACARRVWWLQCRFSVGIFRFVWAEVCACASLVGINWFWLGHDDVSQRSINIPYFVCRLCA